jgi:hypothetical protein
MNNILKIYKNKFTVNEEFFYIEATGVKRRKYGNARRDIKVRSNPVEFKLD